MLSLVQYIISRAHALSTYRGRAKSVRRRGGRAPGRLPRADSAANQRPPTVALANPTWLLRAFGGPCHLAAWRRGRRIRCIVKVRRHPDRPRK